MKKLTVLFVIFILVLTNAPIFAEEKEETKAHPWSPFNIVNDWFNSVGKRADGTWVWEFERDEKSALTAEEIMERRGRIGAGMRGRID